MRVRETDLTAGLLIRREIRELLEVLKMLKHIEDFRKVKRMFSSNFYIMNADETAMNTFKRWHELTITK